MPFTYATCCVNVPQREVKDLQEMIDAARDVTYQTVLKHVGRAELSAVFPDYAWGFEQGLLRLKDDWAVSYHKSRFKGKPCYYVRHSAIEYIFTKEPDWQLGWKGEAHAT